MMKVSGCPAPLSRFCSSRPFPRRFIAIAVLVNEEAWLFAAPRLLSKGGRFDATDPMLTKCSMFQHTTRVVEEGRSLRRLKAVVGGRSSLSFRGERRALLPCNYQPPRWHHHPKSRSGCISLTVPDARQNLGGRCKFGSAMHNQCP